MAKRSTPIVIYDPLTRERGKHAAAHEAGKCALFQRRLAEDDLQYEAHYLSPAALRFLDFVSSNLHAFTQGC